MAAGFFVAPILSMELGGGSRTVAAAAWHETDDDAWDIVGAEGYPVAEAILKPHFSRRTDRLPNAIRRFMELGHHGCWMEPPARLLADSATEAARALLLSLGSSPYR